MGLRGQLAHQGFEPIDVGTLVEEIIGASIEAAGAVLRVGVLGEHRHADITPAGLDALQ